MLKPGKMQELAEPIANTQTEIFTIQKIIIIIIIISVEMV